MTTHQSLSGLEQEIRHGYRNNLNNAESTADIRKFFFYAVRELLDQVFENRVELDFDDIQPDPDSPMGCVWSGRLLNNREFIEYPEKTELDRIISRFAESAINHLKHLESRHPDKTEAKMYPASSHSGQRFSNPPTPKNR